MKLYKLTNVDWTTRNKTLWGPGVTHTVPVMREDPALCTSDVIHAYSSPYLGLFFNGIHANFPYPIVWEAEGEPVVEDENKIGCHSLTTTKILNVNVSSCQRTAFVILCFRQFSQDKKWNKWADEWLGLDTRNAFIKFFFNFLPHWPANNIVACEKMVRRLEKLGLKTKKEIGICWTVRTAADYAMEIYNTELGNLESSYHYNTQAEEHSMSALSAFTESVFNRIDLKILAEKAMKY